MTGVRGLTWNGSPFTDYGVAPGVGSYFDLAAGTYTFTEQDFFGWDLTSIACDTGSWSGDLEDRTLTVNLGLSEDVTCTFTNTEFLVVDLFLPITIKYP